MFTRLSVHEFGPIPLTAVRSAIAAATLLPVLFISGNWPVFQRCWPHLAVVGLISTALPFSCITITTLHTSAGFAAILNSLTPIFSAAIAWFWIKEYLNIPAIIGIGLGFAGVVIMVTDTQTITSDYVLLPIFTGIAAATFYGLTGNYSRRFLTGISPIAIAAGCQFFAALALFPVAFVLWPEAAITPAGWMSAVVLGIVCTGMAFLLYFHLLANVGVAKTVIVTYLIPVFAMLWGFLFLGEGVTGKMLGGAFFILTGITLTSGILRRRREILGRT